MSTAPVVPSPSTAASTPVGAGDGKTDAEILDGTPSTAPAPDTTAAPAPDTTPAPAAVPPVTEPAAPPAEPKPVAPGESMPEALRRASAADPAARAEINRVWAQLQNYLPLGPVQSLKELVAKFPGGVAEADRIINDAIGIQAVDAQFYEGGPEQRAELIKTLYADDPAAVVGTTEVSLQFLRDTAPQEYARLSDGIISNALAKGELGGVLQHLYDEAAKTPDNPLFKLINDVYKYAAEKAGLTPKATDPRQAEFDRRKAELDKRDQTFSARELQSFNDNFNSTVVPAVGAEIDAVLGNLIKDVPVADGAKNLISEQILDAVDEALKGDKTLQYQITQLMSLKRYDKSILDQRVNLTVERAKVLLPAIVNDIFGKWTTNVLAINKATLDKKTAAASRPDIVGGGAGDTRRPATPKATEVDYSKTSDEDILSGNIKRRSA